MKIDQDSRISPLRAYFTTGKNHIVEPFLGQIETSTGVTILSRKGL